MKRKLSLLAIVVALVLVLTMIFVACNKKDDDANTSGGSSITADYNYQQIASKVTELAGSNGIFVKLHISSTDNGRTETYDIALGVRGQVYYFLTSEGESYVDLTSDQYYDVYTTYNGTWRKVRANYSEQVTKDTLITSYAAMAYGYFGMYQYLTTYEGVKTTATVAGRSCDKYTFTQSAYGATASSEVCIDKATGICLKWAASGSYQGDSGAITFECTQFDTNYTITLPQDGQAVTPSGGGQQGGSGEGGQQGGSGEGGQQGGSGEVPVDSVFANKKLVATSVDCSNNTVASYFTNAHASLFMSGDFELVSGLGVLFGTYTVQDNDRYVAMTTSKGFDFEDAEYYHTIPQSLQSLSIVREENGFRLDMRVPIENSAIVDATIHMRDSGTSPMREELPNDPNGDSFSTQYQVEQSSWDYFFKDNGLLLGGTHCTIAYSSDDSYDAPGTFKIDGLKMHDDWTLMSQYYERTGTTPDSLGCYAFNVYSQDNDNWRMASGSYELAHFNQWTGIVPVPFARLSYNGTGHYYYVSSFTYRVYGESQDREIQNFRAYFENGKLKQIQYKFQYTTYTFVYSAHNATTVTLPEVGGGGSGGGEDTTDFSSYYAALANKTLVYNRVTNNSGYLTSEELALAAEASEGTILSIFSENAAELYFAKEFDYDQVDDVVSTYYGTLRFTEYVANSGNPYIKGRIEMSTVVDDGVAYTDGLSNMMVRWYINDSQMRLQMGDYFIYLDLTNTTPTHIPMPSGGEGGGSIPTLYKISDDFDGETALQEFILGLSDGTGIQMTAQQNNDGDITTISYEAKGGIYKSTDDDDVMYFDATDEYSINAYYYDDDKWTMYGDMGWYTVETGMRLSFFTSYQYMFGEEGTREEATREIGGTNYNVYRYTYEDGEVLEVERTTGLCVYYSETAYTYQLTSLKLSDVADIVLPTVD